jgi:hypothetical protein
MQAGALSERWRSPGCEDAGKAASTCRQCSGT